MGNVLSTNVSLPSSVRVFCAAVIENAKTKKKVSIDRCVSRKNVQFLDRLGADMSKIIESFTGGKIFLGEKFAAAPVSDCMR